MVSAANRDAALARRLLGVLDLTTLNDEDDPETIRRLAGYAATPAGRVAALCTWARLIPAALECLTGSGVPVAAVANFPAGDPDVPAAASQCSQAVAAGAAEVDVVFPWRSFLAGDRATPLALVQACRAACGQQAHLKVILETGQLGTPERIRAAAWMPSRRPRRRVSGWASRPPAASAPWRMRPLSWHCMNVVLVSAARALRCSASVPRSWCTNC